MSRSIHATRKEVTELEETEFARRDDRDAALARARDRLEQKRRIKEAVRHERINAAAGTTPVETVPVVVTETGEHVRHGASVEDVRAVLRRLPRGVVDGLTRVELQLGAEYQVAREREDPVLADPDPLVGRLGYETYPGVWCGRVLGTYSPDTAVIRVNAYVFDAAAPLRDVWETMLRLHALSTLVHEVGHHHDHTMRVARGRWLAQGVERVEIYAEDRQHVWLQLAVVPYLREAYPANVEHLESWIAFHGGVRLSLEMLADDPRGTRKGGYVNVNASFWSMHEFVEGLVKQVIGGTPLQDCRTMFARDLHYRELYEEAHRSLNVVLREEPEHATALTLRADILVHQDRNAEALAIVDAVVARTPDYADAWEVAADAYEGLARWREMHDAASRLVRLYEGDRWPRFHALMQRATAGIRLGDLEGARADFALLDAEYPQRMNVTWVKRIRAELDRAGAQP